MLTRGIIQESSIRENRIELELYPTYHSYNVTRYFLTLIVSLNGLGKTVQSQVNVEIIRGSDS